MQDFGIADACPRRESGEKSHPRALFIATSTGFATSWGFPFPVVQPSSSERMLLLCRGTTRILSWPCTHQWHQRWAPARHRGTHRNMVLYLAENHILRFLCLGFQVKLPAPSPRLWDETAELQMSSHSFQQNPRDRKMKQISFPQRRTVKEWLAPGKPPEVSRCPTGSVCHVSNAGVSPFADWAPALPRVTAAPQFCSAGSCGQVNSARTSALPEGSSTALVKTCSVKPLAVCMPPAPPWGPAALAWHQVMSPTPQCLPLLKSSKGKASPGWGRKWIQAHVLRQRCKLFYKSWALIIEPGLLAGAAGKTGPWLTLNLMAFGHAIPLAYLKTRIPLSPDIYVVRWNPSSHCRQRHFYSTVFSKARSSPWGRGVFSSCCLWDSGKKQGQQRSGQRAL